MHKSFRTHSALLVDNACQFKVKINILSDKIKKNNIKGQGYPTMVTKPLDDPT